MQFESNRNEKKSNHFEEFITIFATQSFRIVNSNRQIIHILSFFCKHKMSHENQIVKQMKRKQREKIELKLCGWVCEIRWSDAKCDRMSKQKQQRNEKKKPNKLNSTFPLRLLIKKKPNRNRDERTKRKERKIASQAKETKRNEKKKIKSFEVESFRSNAFCCLNHKNITRFASVSGGPLFVTFHSSNIASWHCVRPKKPLQLCRNHFLLRRFWHFNSRWKFQHTIYAYARRKIICSFCSVWSDRSPLKLCWWNWQSKSVVCARECKREKTRREHEPVPCRTETKKVKEKRIKYYIFHCVWSLRSWNSFVPFSRSLKREL